MASEFLSPSFRRQFFSSSTPIVSLTFGLIGVVVGTITNTFSSGAYSLGACLGWGFAIGCVVGMVLTAMLISALPNRPASANYHAVRTVVQQANPGANKVTEADQISKDLVDKLLINLRETTLFNELTPERTEWLIRIMFWLQSTTPTRYSQLCDMMAKDQSLFCNFAKEVTLFEPGSQQVEEINKVVDGAIRMFQPPVSATELRFRRNVKKLEILVKTVEALREPASHNEGQPNSFTPE